MSCEEPDDPNEVEQGPECAGEATVKLLERSQSENPVGSDNCMLQPSVCARVDAGNMRHSALRSIVGSAHGEQPLFFSAHSLSSHAVRRWNSGLFLTPPVLGAGSRPTARIPALSGASPSGPHDVVKQDKEETGKHAVLLSSVTENAIGVVLSLALAWLCITKGPSSHASKVGCFASITATPLGLHSSTRSKRIATQNIKDSATPQAAATARSGNARRFALGVVKFTWALIDVPIRVVEYLLLGPPPLEPYLPKRTMPLDAASTEIHHPTTTPSLASAWEAAAPHNLVMLIDEPLPFIGAVSTDEDLLVKASQAACSLEATTSDILTPDVTPSDVTPDVTDHTLHTPLAAPQPETPATPSASALISESVEEHEHTTLLADAATAATSAAEDAYAWLRWALQLTTKEAVDGVVTFTTEDLPAMVAQLQARFAKDTTRAALASPELLAGPLAGRSVVADLTVTALTVLALSTAVQQMSSWMQAVAGGASAKGGRMAVGAQDAAAGGDGRRTAGMLAASVIMGQHRLEDAIQYLKCDLPPPRCDLPQRCELPPPRCDLPPKCDLPPPRCTLPPPSCDLPQKCDLPPAKCDLPPERFGASGQAAEARQPGPTSANAAHSHIWSRRTRVMPDPFSHPDDVYSSAFIPMVFMGYQIQDDAWEAGGERPKGDAASVATSKVEPKGVSSAAAYVKPPATAALNTWPRRTRDSPDPFSTPEDVFSSAFLPMAFSGYDIKDEGWRSVQQQEQQQPAEVEGRPSQTWRRRVRDSPDPFSWPDDVYSSAFLPMAFSGYDIDDYGWGSQKDKEQPAATTTSTAPASASAPSMATGTAAAAAPVVGQTLDDVQEAIRFLESKGYRLVYVPQGEKQAEVEPADGHIRLARGSTLNTCMALAAATLNVHTSLNDQPAMTSVSAAHIHNSSSTSMTVSVSTTGSTGLEVDVIVQDLSSSMDSPPGMNMAALPTLDTLDTPLVMPAAAPGTEAIPASDPTSTYAHGDVFDQEFDGLDSIRRYWNRVLDKVDVPALHAHTGPIDQSEDVDMSTNSGPAGHELMSATFTVQAGSKVPVGEQNVPSISVPSVPCACDMDAAMAADATAATEAASEVDDNEYVWVLNGSVSTRVRKLPRKGDKATPAAPSPLKIGPVPMSAAPVLDGMLTGKEVDLSNDNNKDASTKSSTEKQTAAAAVADAINASILAASNTAAPAVDSTLPPPPARVSLKATLAARRAVVNTPTGPRHADNKFVVKVQPATATNASTTATTETKTASDAITAALSIGMYPADANATPTETPAIEAPPTVREAPAPEAPAPRTERFVSLKATLEARRAASTSPAPPAAMRPDRMVVKVAPAAPGNRTGNLATPTTSVATAVIPTMPAAPAAASTPADPIIVDSSATVKATAAVAAAAAASSPAAAVSAAATTAAVGETLDVVIGSSDSSSSRAPSLLPCFSRRSVRYVLSAPSTNKTTEPAAPAPTPTHEPEATAPAAPVAVAAAEATPAAAVSAMPLINSSNVSALTEAFVTQSLQFIVPVPPSTFTAAGAATVDTETTASHVAHADALNAPDAAGTVAADEAAAAALAKEIVSNVVAKAYLGESKVDGVNSAIDIQAPGAADSINDSINRTPYTGSRTALVLPSVRYQYYANAARALGVTAHRSTDTPASTPADSATLPQAPAPAKDVDAPTLAPSNTAADTLAVDAPAVVVALPVDPVVVNHTLAAVAAADAAAVTATFPTSGGAAAAAQKESTNELIAPFEVKAEEAAPIVAISPATATVTTDVQDKTTTTSNNSATARHSGPVPRHQGTQHLVRYHITRAEGASESRLTPTSPEINPNNDDSKKADADQQQASSAVSKVGQAKATWRKDFDTFGFRKALDEMRADEQQDFSAGDNSKPPAPATPSAPDADLTGGAAGGVDEAPVKRTVASAGKVIHVASGVNLGHLNVKSSSPEPKVPVPQAKQASPAPPKAMSPLPKPPSPQPNASIPKAKAASPEPKAMPTKAKSSSPAPMAPSPEPKGKGKSPGSSLDPSSRRDYLVYQKDMRKFIRYAPPSTPQVAADEPQKEKSKGFGKPSKQSVSSPSPPTAKEKAPTAKVSPLAEAIKELDRKFGTPTNMMPPSRREYQMYLQDGQIYVRYKYGTPSGTAPSTGSPASASDASASSVEGKTPTPTQVVIGRSADQQNTATNQTSTGSNNLSVDGDDELHAGLDALSQALRRKPAKHRPLTSPLDTSNNVLPKFKSQGAPPNTTTTSPSPTSTPTSASPASPADPVADDSAFVQKGLQERNKFKTSWIVDG